MIKYIYLIKMDIKYTISNDDYGKQVMVNSDTSGYNIEINIIIKDEIYKTSEDITIGFENKEDIKYNLRLVALYSQKSIDKPRAPIGITRKLLCNLIYKLLSIGDIKIDDILLLEADPSPNSKLLKMYESMSFVNKGYAIVQRNEYQSDMDYIRGIRDRGAVMTTTIRNILQWYNNKFTLDTNYIF